MKEEQSRIEQASKPATWAIEKKGNKASQNIVVVVGESVRKDFLHAYGFPVSNTPFIANSPNIKFNNYISVAFSTIASLLRTIVLPEPNLKDYQMNNSVVTLAKKAGYKTYWLSNANRIWINDANPYPTSIVAEQSDFVRFISQNLMGHEDSDMLPYLDGILSEDSDASKFIVFHMLGSHPNACDRTYGKYDEFVNSKEVSCYIKTIRMLDDFLKTIHQKLENANKPYTLIYFSDHGVMLKDESFVHSGSVQETFNVPLLLWNDTITTSKEINATRRGFDFLHFMSEVFDIKTKNINLKYKFISEDKNEDTIINVLDRNGNISDYDNLENNPIDFIFEK